eukprot:Sspe_Gene.32087::Locus_15753_Transcript_1_1_Confidence_1.000_Length_1022::g.32087::m.32087
MSSTPPHNTPMAACHAAPEALVSPLYSPGFPGLLLHSSPAPSSGRAPSVGLLDHIDDTPVAYSRDRSTPREAFVSPPATRIIEHTSPLLCALEEGTQTYFVPSKPVEGVFQPSPIRGEPPPTHPTHRKGKHGGIRGKPPAAPSPGLSAEALEFMSPPSASTVFLSASQIASPPTPQSSPLTPIELRAMGPCLMPQDILLPLPPCPSDPPSKGASGSPSDHPSESPGNPPSTAAQDDEKNSDSPAAQLVEEEVKRLQEMEAEVERRRREVAAMESQRLAKEREMARREIEVLAGEYLVGKKQLWVEAAARMWE